MPLGDSYRVRTVCYTPEQISVNVTHWLITDATGPVPTSLPSKWAVVFDDALRISYLPWMSSKARWRGVGAQPFFGIATSAEGVSVGNDTPGTGSATIQATQVSGLIKWATATVGRHGRGRIYPGFADELFQNADGSLSAGGATALGLIRTSYMTPPVLTSGGSTETATLCVRSVTGGLVAFNTVIIATARLRWATQRRRGQLGRTNTVPF